MTALCKKILAISALALLFAPGMANVAFSADSPAPEKVTVEAEGSGETKMAAMKEAWTNAVRKAVGMYMTSKTETLNDDLTEQIAAYSRGQVNSFETLSENQENGNWHIKIKANVDRDIMQETVAASASQNVKVDGTNIAAQIQSAEDKKKDAAEVLKSSGLMDFTKCLDYKPEIQTVDNEGKKIVFMRHMLKFDLDKFKKQADELEKLVATMAISKRTASLKTDAAKAALKLIAQNDFKVNFSTGEIIRNMMKDGNNQFCLVPGQRQIGQGNNNDFIDDYGLDPKLTGLGDYASAQNCEFYLFN